MMSIDKNKKRERLVVYTALFGNYDDLIDPPKKFEGCDFICFTDQAHLKSDVWEVRLIKECDLPPNMMNRRYKILPHLFFPEYQSSLYVDANVGILKNPKDLAAKYLSQYDFVAPKHFARNCVYDEARECIVLMKDDPASIKKQMQRYKHEGLPVGLGLTENNILLRNHNVVSVIAAMTAWWKELQNETKRDQLSLPYVIWRSSLKFFQIEESARVAGYFSYKQHRATTNQSFMEKLKGKLNIELRRIFFNWL